MNSSFRCVAAIIEKSTAVAMKRHGGKRQALIRPFLLVFCGCKVIHYRQRAATTATPDQRIGRGPNHKTKPILEVGRQ